jgi:hypothetical protein
MVVFHLWKSGRTHNDTHVFIPNTSHPEPFQKFTASPHYPCLSLERNDRFDDAAVAIEPAGKGIDHRLR